MHVVFLYILWFCICLCFLYTVCVSVYVCGLSSICAFVYSVRACIWFVFLCMYGLYMHGVYGDCTSACV